MNANHLIISINTKPVHLRGTFKWNGHALSPRPIDIILQTTNFLLGGTLWAMTWVEKLEWSYKWVVASQRLVAPPPSSKQAPVYRSPGAFLMVQI